MLRVSDEHLFWSYRLAKFEVTGEGRGVGRVSFARFEDQLATELRTIRDSANSLGDFFRSADPGRIWVRPKSVDRDGASPDGSSHIAVPEQAEDQKIRGMTVRVLLEPTPQFAIAEVLWLRAFGPALDALLVPECLANRLVLRGEPPAVPVDARSIFAYWPRSYRKFRHGALDAAQRLLKAGRDVRLSALDLASYYDNIDPGFLVEDHFVEQVHAAARARHVVFDAESYVEATAGLLAAFSRASRLAADMTKVKARSSSVRGIPVGSLASRLIANLALAELDRLASTDANVRHYARYVDDILIVESPGERLERHRLIPDCFPRKAQTQKAIELDVNALRRAGSSFQIQHAKLRVFDLRGEQGREYLHSVEAELDKLSSQRRRFIDPSAQDLEETVAASPRSEPIHALREADALSIRKLAVATACNKVLTAATMIDRADAAHFSRAYLGKPGRLATDWSRWVDLLDVSLKVLGVALVSGDKNTANEIIHALRERVMHLTDRVAPSFRVRWGSSQLRRERARQLIAEWIEAQLVEVVCGSAPFDDAGFVTKGIDVLERGLRFRNGGLTPEELLANARALARADLRLLDRESDIAIGCVRAASIPAGSRHIARELQSDPVFDLRSEHIGRFLEACATVDDGTYAGCHPVDFLLSARPPTYTDILFRWLRAQRPLTELIDVVNAVRGTRYRSLTMRLDGDELWVDEPVVTNLQVDNTRIVLGNLSTNEAWWEQSLRSPACGSERLQRLARVLNQGIEAARRATKKTSPTPTLLVLPELSVPRKWQRGLFRHLVRNAPQLSVVLGLEYDVIGNKVFNEAVAFVPRGYSSSAGWVWTKRRPAHHEGPELVKNGYVFASRASGHRFVVMCSEHGRFLPLICSEILEVDTRAMLLGRVDLLLVPSWNPDTLSFEYFIQSAPLELHSFVAIANNGVFSDCRMRAPYHEHSRREVCRLIARHQNETVVADIPIGKLRAYHSNPSVNGIEKLWKPLPPGWPNATV